MLTGEKLTFLQFGDLLRLQRVGKRELVDSVSKQARGVQLSVRRLSHPHALHGICEGSGRGFPKMQHGADWVRILTSNINVRLLGGTAFNGVIVNSPG